VDRNSPNSPKIPWGSGGKRGEMFAARSAAGGAKMAMRLVPRAAPAGRKEQRYHTRASAAGLRERWGQRVEVFAFGSSLHLLPPGSRKDNPWLVRGTLADGRHIEATNKTTDLDAAKAFARDVGWPRGSGNKCANFAADYQPAESRFRRKSWAAAGSAGDGTARTLAVPLLFLAVSVRTQTIETCPGARTSRIRRGL
jgi:hypothetical protein